MISLRPHPHLYEINTWLWLETLSRRHGRRLTLATVPDEEWDSLNKKGFDLVWLMGVWERSHESRRIFQNDAEMYPQFQQALPDWDRGKIVGSPYSVQAYCPDPRIGTWADLTHVRAKLNERRMALILDFVPNHTSLDHSWVTSHPEYYMRGTAADAWRDPDAFFLTKSTRGVPVAIARARDPYFPPWKDLAQLNLFAPATRAALVGEIREIARFCDGVRADMAMLILNDVFAKTWHALLATDPPPDELWSDIFPRLPSFLGIAEVYWDMEVRLQQLGFQFTYDKVFYDLLRGGRPQDVLAHLHADPAVQRRMVHFLENHDEQRSATAFGAERLPAAAALLATLPGMRFYHQGQLEGKKVYVPIMLGEAAEEPPDPAIVALYEKTLRLSNADVFHAGEWKLLETGPAGEDSSENMIAYRWRTKAAHAILVINLGSGTSQARIPLAGEILPDKNYTLLDQWTGTSYLRQGSEMATQGLFVRLTGYGVHWFDVSTAA